MTLSRKLVGLVLLVVVWLGLAAGASAQQTFTISVPIKGTGVNSPPPFQLGTVRLTFSFVSVPNVKITGVAFTVKDPRNISWTPTGALPASHTFSPVPPSPAVTSDIVSVLSPDPTYDSDHYKRFEIDFQLSSNYNPQNCGGTMSSAETYTVVATPTFQAINSSVPAPAPTLSGLCLESYDYRDATGTCLGSPTTFVLGSASDRAASVTVSPAGITSAVTCFKERSNVDAALVLDKSGSMADPSSGGGAGLPPPRIKIEALQKSVSDFVSAWNTARSTDSTPPSPPPTPDQIGVVLFDSAAVPWTDNPPGLTSSPLLNHFSDVQASMLTVLATCNVNTCGGTPGQLVPGTSTSIGAGLIRAYSAFTNDSNRPVILLMTDGMQNTDPKIQIQGGQTFIYCDNPSAPPCTTSIPAIPSGCMITAASPCPLTRFNPLANPPRIYTVTVGYGTGVADDSIVQPVATNSGGFYINTELDMDQLSPFFLELLQNVLKFNSYETVRIISGKTTPFATSVPLSTTSHDAEFSLMWPANLGMLKLTITPPGATEPIVKQSSTGFISIVQVLPPSQPLDPAGAWKILVEAVNPAGTSVMEREGAAGIPFNLHVMEDDGKIKADLTIVPGDHLPGDNIRLRAKLTQFGRPILGLGTQPGELVAADLIEPGKSLGDILSDSPASSNPPSSNPDLHPGAEAKLFNTLQTDASLFTHQSHTVQLFDDGRPEHGDDVAGDGIYNALYRATLPGHYTFLLTAERTASNTEHFSRQQLKTAFARPIPDSGNTVFQTNVLRRDNANVLSIVMTPRFKPGPRCPKKDPKCGRMGPGWANYFWFTAAGIAPFKAVDNLNGTYTATLPFAGNTPPNVQVHFEDVVALIVDTATPDQLPQPLGPGNVLTTVPSPNSLAGKFAVFLDLGAGIPHGTFGTAFKTGFSLNAGLEYIATSHFSAEGIFGYHYLPAKIGGALDLYQFSANGKFYLTSSGPLRPFVNGGIGGYKFSPGSTYFGGNFGGGILYELGPHWGLQGSYNFHAVNTPGAATKFSTVQGGIRFEF